MSLAFSQACENNKQPILAILKQAFSDTKQVLEIGSGTGQHAVYFAKYLPHLHWYPSDLLDKHPAIIERIQQTRLTNIAMPQVLDLSAPWPKTFQQNNLQLNTPLTIDGIFSANTLHIVSWPLVQELFSGVKQHLANNGILAIYGPFNYQGQYTSTSNAQFDLWLKERDKNSAIRNFEDVLELAQQANLSLLNDHPMPANNRLLVFKKLDL